MQQQKDEGKLDSAYAFGLLYVLANAHRTCLTVFMRHSFGTRAFDPHGLVAFLGLLLLAGANWVFRLYFVVWFLVLLGQRFYSYRLRWAGRDGHSAYQGYPWLAMRWPGIDSEEKARVFEPVACMFAGGILLTIYAPLGVFVSAGFFSFGTCLVIDSFIDRRRIQAMKDAEIEMKYYADKWRERKR